MVQKMRAITLEKAMGLNVAQVDKPDPATGEVLIQLKYAALNHLDLWTWQEGTTLPYVIPGSDGSGIVTAVGNEVDARWIGKEVLINPGVFWGCDEKSYSNAFRIIGNDVAGTFAEYISVPEENIHEKPAYLTLKEAAAMSMAGVTAYRALFTKAQLTARDAVLITGIGGGLAQALLQMAVAKGAAVYVTSSNTEKIEKAKACGAREGFHYKERNWLAKAKKVAGGFDVIIDSAGGNGFSTLTTVANNGARIILLGKTAGTINNLNPAIVFNKQLHIMGTVMGSPQDFAAMLQFHMQHQLHPVIERSFPFYHAPSAFNYLKKGTHYGKILVDIDINS